MKFLKVAGIIIGVISVLLVAFQCGYDYRDYELNMQNESDE